MKRLVVIGGGASGMFCAVTAARLSENLEVLVLEKTSKLLSKVRISGGGRCNVTHACFSVTEMLKKYPRGGNFLKKSFSKFFTHDTIAWFEERKVKLKTEPDGRVFPVSDDSQSIIDCLITESYLYQVNIEQNQDVKTIFPQADGTFEIHTAIGSIFQADYVCVSCGGFPKIHQFDWLVNLGHSIVEPVPSLFTFNLIDREITELAGVSVPETSIKITGTKLNEKGATLATHWGISGPAVLKLSAWGARELYDKNYDFSVMVNWLLTENENTLREKWQQIRQEKALQKIKNANPFPIPQRLWEYLLRLSGVNPEHKWSELPAKEQNKLISNLCSQPLEVSGKTTFKEEFVTAGGIDLAEVDAQTMQSKKIENLYFAGEILDVDGITGGFNFQHAWTSGYVAAKYIAEKANLKTEISR
jgi:predicted Rossmann fold flavoprotein